jgi:hypothetical protein
MAKKPTGGLVALVAGVAAGAAAVFFSKKENREMVKREAVKAGSKAKAVASEVRKDSKKVAKKVQAQGKKLAGKVVREARKDAKKAGKRVVAAEKAVARKVKSSPVLKAVGKKAGKRR